MMTPEDKIKITPEELDLYASVAEIFEEWLETNPPDPDSEEPERLSLTDSVEEQAMKQSRLYAKTYLQLYILFLKLIPRINSEEIDFGDSELKFNLEDPEDPKARIIKKFMAEKRFLDDMSEEDKEMFAEKLENFKGTFH